MTKVRSFSFATPPAAGSGVASKLRFSRYVLRAVEERSSIAAALNPGNRRGSRRFPGLKWPSRSGSRAELVAQHLDLVVVALCALQLALDDQLDAGRQRLLQGLAIAGQRIVFTTLALFQYRL